jgi:hypothetical protein
VNIGIHSAIDDAHVHFFRNRAAVPVLADQQFHARCFARTRIGRSAFAPAIAARHGANVRALRVDEMILFDD